MLQAIHLRNFKCFESKRISLGALTLLSGLNGTGKSTTLQALLLLRQSHQSGLLAQGRLLLNGELVQLGTAHDTLNESADPDTISFSLEHTQDIFSWSYEYNASADVLRATQTPADPKAIACNLFGSDVNYLCAERVGPRTAYTTSDFLVREQRQLGTHGEFAAHFLELHGDEQLRDDQERLCHRDAVSRNLLDQVTAWLGELCPGVRLDIKGHPGLDLVRLGFSFEVGSEYGVSNSYRPTNVGFGLTYTLPLLVAILAARRGSLLLLENPEAHLHPRAQTRIGELLALAADCGVQIVIETHSDHVLNGMRIAVHRGQLAPSKVCLHFFMRSARPDKISHDIESPTIDRRGRISQWPDGFFDEYEKSLDVLLDEPVADENSATAAVAGATNVDPQGT
jgi:predicted ATPase